MQEIRFLGIYFFLSDDIVYSERSVYTLLHLISDFGGLYEVVAIFFIMIGVMINKQIIMGKLIRSLYFKHVVLDENKLKSHDN